MATATLQKFQFTVAAEHAGQRVDNYLFRELKSVPKQLIYRLLRQGKVRVNDKKVKPESRLGLNDRLAVPALRARTAVAEITATVDLPPVVFEDDDYLVLAKPAGLAVHGGSGLSFGLIELARHVRAMPWLELVHRLDKDTSGIIVLAKNRAGLRWLHAELRDNRVKKIYQTVVFGKWRKAYANIELNLRKILADHGGRRMLVVKDGVKAITRTTCTQQSKSGALLRIELVTGKTHQARVHLAHVGLPIVGDSRYGDFARNKQAHAAGHRGLFLHASQLAFTNRHGDQIKVTAKLPAGFSKIRPWLQ